MLLIHPDGRVWDHFTEEPDMRLSELILKIRHVGDGNDGPCFDPRIVKVVHGKNPETGKTYMEIFVDASRVIVKP
jgi:hypothetical protein